MLTCAANRLATIVSAMMQTCIKLALVHMQDVAGWLLVHHAKKLDTIDDMLTNNAHTIALSMCQDKNLLIAERTIAAALLVDMASRTDLHDVLLKTRAASRICAVALLDVALNVDNHVQLRLRTAHALAKLTAQKDNATSAMVNFQQMLPWAMLARLLSAVELDMSLKGHLAMFLRNVLVKVCTLQPPASCCADLVRKIVVWL
jgi:hypothetical protein